MKYVMFQVDGPLTKQLVPVIFPNHLVHKVVAEEFITALLKHSPKRAVTIVSAGDVLIDATCYGNSGTLKLPSKAEDSNVINDYDHFHGIME